MAASEAPKQRYQGVQKESAGYKLLAAMGWREGEGLGASAQGIKEHIRVKKNYDNWGVGAVQAADRARDWSNGMVEFHRVLSTLSEVTSKHAGKKRGEGEDSDSSASDASDGELVAARTASKSTKKGKKKGKQEKKAGKAAPVRIAQPSSSSGSDDVDSDEEEEAAAVPAAAPPPAKRAKLATHLGRFKKRESAKMVKHYSTTDLAAILGGDPFAAAAVQEVRAEHATVNTSDSGSDSEGEAPAATRVPPADSARDPTSQPLQEEQAEMGVEAQGRWWSGYFVPSGRMGALSRAAAADKPRGFSEQDQTDLYNKAQGGATQGRVGLGRSGAMKKVAGARWSGKRTKLGSDSEEEAPPEQGQEEEVEDGMQARVTAGGIVIVMPTPKRREAMDAAAVEQAAAAPAAGGAAAPELGGIKWKRAVAAVLKESGTSGLKLGRLHKAVRKREGLHRKHSGEVARLVTACVQASTKFSINGNAVQLASS